MGFKFNPLEGILDLSKNNQSGPPQPSTSAEKLVASFTAGETISALKLVYIAASAEAFVAASDLTFTEAQAIGVALNAALAGAQVEVQLFGLLQDAGLSFAANELLFLGPLGTIVSSQPATGFATRVGYGLGSGAIFLNVEKPIVL